MTTGRSKAARTPTRIDSRGGHGIVRSVSTKPLKCERAQFVTGFQRPDGAGRITVPMCVALTGGQTT
jgi:hypothetical protein